MTNFKGVLFVGAGMIVGCGAMAAAPVSRSWAQYDSTSGGWECYDPEEFPSVVKASSDSGAQNLAAGLNKVAAHVQSGTIIAVAADGTMRGTNPQMLCVKN